MTLICFQEYKIEHLAVISQAFMQGHIMIDRQAVQETDEPLEA
jgi:hypothetical protein